MYTGHPGHTFCFLGFCNNDFNEIPERVLICIFSPDARIQDFILDRMRWGNKGTQKQGGPGGPRALGGALRFRHKRERYNGRNPVSTSHNISLYLRIAFRLHIIWLYDPVYLARDPKISAAELYPLSNEYLDVMFLKCVRSPAMIFDLKSRSKWYHPRKWTRMWGKCLSCQAFRPCLRFPRRHVYYCPDTWRNWTHSRPTVLQPNPKIPGAE